MLILIEGMVMCFILLMICVIGIANGPAGLVTFFEQDVKDRAVALGYTTKDRIKKSTAVTAIALFAPIIFLVPFMVYCMNGVTEFWSGFWQMLMILWIMGLFDRVFIDWYWVGHTKAWVIAGTEDLMPYIPRKTVVRKWLGTIIGYPIIAALLAGIMTFIIR